MTRQFFRQMETRQRGDRIELTEFIDHLSWSEQQLIPVVTQQYDSGEVLMVAWMNAESLRLTLEEGWVTYWSRSRQCLWRKGETSGNRQRLIELRADCDGDTLLCLADQQGPACHTGRDNCFYYTMLPHSGEVVVNASQPETA
ncbi:phosphoribosyl-AMP cyclohydrolase [Marinobacterium jannaschii]|uniref:phosphoribosyl-AMP cyclohydrolase n=1 Tax=Marinobacterium jannaschii TaxID=64970 RepID=UPI000481A6B2|nr:phosphoribosyl-AMP cyclohydrolase [Marinobacterium jannaschii]